MIRETRNVGVIMEDAVDRTGWSQDSIIDVLFDYIQAQDDNATFAAYLDELIEDELNS